MLAQQGSDLPLRRSMIVLSDGINEKTGRTAAQCIELAKQNFIDVHSLIFLPTQNSRVLAGKGELEVISKDSGGVTFTAFSAEQISEGIKKLDMEMVNEIVLSVPLHNLPINGLNHTLGINYENVSKKVAFLISENELSRIKLLATDEDLDIPEKLWIYLFITGALSFLLAFFLWRKSVIQKKLLSAPQNEVTANPPPPAGGETINDIEKESMNDSSNANNIGIVKTDRVAMASQLKTEYRAPASDRQITSLVHIGDSISSRAYRLNGLQIFIGAHLNNDILINMPSVSGRHAVLMQTTTGYTIADLNSTNGTFVNGTRIGQLPVTLVIGQEVRLGLAVFRVE